MGYDLEYIKIKMTKGEDDKRRDHFPSAAAPAAAGFPAFLPCQAGQFGLRCPWKTKEIQIWKKQTRKNLLLAVEASEMLGFLGPVGPFPLATPGVPGPLALWPPTTTLTPPVHCTTNAKLK